mgnify:CR=1 FL=1
MGVQIQCWLDIDFILIFKKQKRGLNYSDNFFLFFKDYLYKIKTHELLSP